MIALLCTSLAGILVFPFFGNSLLTLIVVSSLLDELVLLLLTLPLTLWLARLSLLRLLRLMISLSRTRSGYPLKESSP